MKKQINPSIKAYLVRGACYLLLLVTLCAIPFALAQRNATNRVAAKAAFKPDAIPAQAPLPSGQVRERAPSGGVCSDYVTSTSTDTIVPGDTDTGNHCDDCTTSITFPFPVSLYGTSFTGALVGANGSLQFTGNSDYFGSACPLPNPSLDEAILPYQDDLTTNPDISPDCSSFPSGCGVFTSITGTAPSRVFHIEWRTGYFNRPGTANFEVRFAEGNPSCFDIIYGSTVDNGLVEVSGVQQSAGGPGATTFSCLAGALTNGLKVTYCCSQPTPTPTPSPSPTPPSQITLSANGYKMRGIDTVDLFWSGAISANIDIKRNGIRIATVPNTPSSYRDSTGQRGPATFVYQVCEAGGGNCSNQVTVRFGGGG